MAFMPRSCSNYQIFYSGNSCLAEKGGKETNCFDANDLGEIQFGGCRRESVTERGAAFHPGAGERECGGLKVGMKTTSATRLLGRMASPKIGQSQMSPDFSHTSPETVRAGEPPVGAGGDSTAPHGKTLAILDGKTIVCILNDSIFKANFNCSQSLFLFYGKQ